MLSMLIALTGERDFRKSMYFLYQLMDDDTNSLIKGKPPTFSDNNVWHLKILAKVTFAVWTVLPMGLRVPIKKVTGRA
jgi:hypothetical protein